MGQQSSRNGPFDIAREARRWGQIDDDVAWRGTALRWNGDKNAGGARLRGWTNIIRHEALPQGWLIIYSNNALERENKYDTPWGKSLWGKENKLKIAVRQKSSSEAKKTLIIALRWRKHQYCREVWLKGLIKYCHEVGLQGQRKYRREARLAM